MRLLTTWLTADSTKAFEIALAGKICNVLGDAGQSAAAPGATAVAGPTATLLTEDQVKAAVQAHLVAAGV
jgi:hypothetical protein